MKIEDIKSLDVGASNVEIEGKIFRALKPRETNYGWGQFIVIDDSTGKQGCNVGVGGKDEGFKQGQCVKVKGKLSDWYKDSRGVDKRTIEGGVFEEVVEVEEEVSQEKLTTPPVQEPTQKSEKVDPKVWEAKDLRMARESALKNIAKYVVAKLVKLGERFKYAQEDVDFIYDGLEKSKKTMVEESLEEFGGTAVEEIKEQYDKLPAEHQEKLGEKELVKNPHLAEPVDDTMATVPQKRQIYGYIDEEGKKIKGIVDSQYIKKAERDKIGKAQDLTRKDSIRYWEYWYGKEGELGERDKREIAVKEKEQEANPFATKREPIEKRDPKDDASLTKDLLIEKINKLREENYLEDDEKFGEALGCNAKFKLWSEKELTKLKEKLEVYRPSCLK